MRRAILTGVFLILLGVGVSGQSTAPLLQPSSLTYLGSFALPSDDGTCDWASSQRGCLNYGGYALGIGPTVNGQLTLYYGGHDWADQLCQLTIPAIGGTAQMVGRCQTLTNLPQIDGTQGYALGGSLFFNGRTLVTATPYYPGGDTAKSTHFVATSLSGLGGAPAVRVGTIKAGSVAGWMTTIPAEWQAALGGKALAGQCCRQIISRTSYGPAAVAFDPDTVGKQNPAPATPLIHYPTVETALAPYSTDVWSPLFTGATEMGGMAFPSGSRSLIFIGKHGMTGRCYGFPTSDKSLHQTPHPAGERWCYDPASGDKGDHGYPYKHYLWFYDANDLAQVKAGKLQPHQVKPYTTAPLDGIPSSANGSASIKGAAYDDTTRRLYVAEHTGGGTPRVHVFSIAGTTTPPPKPVDCQLSEWGDWQAVTPWSACSNSQQFQQQRRTKTIIVPPAHNGAACGPTEETRTATQGCTVTPPATTSIEVKGTLVYDPFPVGGGKYYIFVKGEGGIYWSGELPGNQIPGSVRLLKAGDFVDIKASLNPAVK